MRGLRSSCVGAGARAAGRRTSLSGCTGDGSILTASAGGRQRRSTLFVPERMGLNPLFVEPAGRGSCPGRQPRGLVMPSVLIVDDDSDICFLERMVLRSADGRFTV